MARSGGGWGLCQHARRRTCASHMGGGVPSTRCAGGLGCHADQGLRTCECECGAQRAQGVPSGWAIMRRGAASAATHVQGTQNGRQARTKERVDACVVYRGLACGTRGGGGAGAGATGVTVEEAGEHSGGRGATRLHPWGRLCRGLAAGIGGPRWSLWRRCFRWRGNDVHAPCRHRPTSACYRTPLPPQRHALGPRTARRMPGRSPLYPTTPLPPCCRHACYGSPPGVLQPGARGVTSRVSGHQ